MRGLRRYYVCLCRVQCLWIVIAAGCATHPSAPSLTFSNVELTEVPFFAQLEHQCGPAALATILSYHGRPVSPADLLSQVYIEGLKGSLQAELLSATRRHGLIPYVLESRAQNIVAEIDAGHPVVVLQNLGFRLAPIWHYAVVVGFDDETDSVILRSGTEKRHLERTARFVRSWRRANGWALIVVRAGELPATARSEPYLHALLDAEKYLAPPDIARAYESAIGRWPEDEMIMFAAATRKLQEASWQEAEEMYRELLARQPNHAAARNNLASVLLAREQYDAALREAERALEQANDPRLIAAIKDTLASIATSSTRVGHARRDPTSPGAP
jgi:tetratricopeptide (TPR) repeat protein